MIIYKNIGKDNIPKKRHLQFYSCEWLCR